MFDPNQFLDMQVTEANDTKRTPCPAGEYLAVIDEVKCRPWASKTDSSKAGMALDITWSIQDANVLATVGREKVTVRQGIMLDLTEQNGLDMGKGKNITLGRVRVATGNNVPGKPFAFSMLQGCLAKVNVTHRMDGEDVYDEIKSTAPAQ